MGSETKLIVKHFKKFLLALIFGSPTTVFSKLPKVRVLHSAYKNNFGGNNYRPYPNNNGNSYGNSYGNA